MWMKSFIHLDNSRIGTLVRLTITKLSTRGWGTTEGKSLIECIHKGGGHTRYDLQYIKL